MASQNRDHVRYHYKQGGRIIHTGITIDPIRRQAEHQRTNPGGHLEQVGHPVTKDEALNWERAQRRQGKPTEGYAELDPTSAALRMLPGQPGISGVGPSIPVFGATDRQDSMEFAAGQEIMSRLFGSTADRTGYYEQNPGQAFNLVLERHFKSHGTRGVKRDTLLDSMDYLMGKYRGRLAAAIESGTRPEWGWGDFVLGGREQEPVDWEHLFADHNRGAIEAALGRAQRPV